MPAQPPGRKVSDFFDLPRELRDEIYGYLWVHERQLNRQQDIIIRVKDIPDKAYQLVSRQFKSELMHIASKAATCLVLEETLHFRFQTLDLGADLLALRHLELHLVLVDDCVKNAHPREECDLYGDLRKHGRWVRPLVSRMHRLQSVDVSLYIESSRPLRHCEQYLRGGCRGFGTLPERYSFEIQSCNYVLSTDLAHFHFSGEKTLLMKYCPETGELERVHFEPTDPHTEDEEGP